MLTFKGDSGRAALTGVFWDPFDVAPAITDLVGGGFSEDEIDAIGVLCGRAPDLTDWLFLNGTRTAGGNFLQRLFCRWSHIAHRPYRTRKPSENRAENAEAAQMHRSPSPGTLRMPVTLPCGNGKGWSSWTKIVEKLD